MLSAAFSALGRLAGFKRGEAPILDPDACIGRFVLDRKPCRASRSSGVTYARYGGERRGFKSRDRGAENYRVFSDGETLWSYDQPIARWRSKNVLEVECREFSVTTNRHQEALGIAIQPRRWDQPPDAEGRQWWEDGYVPPPLEKGAYGFAVVCARLTPDWDTGWKGGEGTYRRVAPVALTSEAVTQNELHRRTAWSRTRSGQPRRETRALKKLRKQFYAEQKARDRGRRANARWRRKMAALEAQWRGEQSRRLFKDDVVFEDFLIEMGVPESRHELPYPEWDD